MKALAGVLFCIPLMAQLSAPKIGFVRYADGTLHSVQGLPSNMIVADVPLPAVGAASFSDSGGLVWRNGSIDLLGPDLSTLAQYPADEKPVLSMDGSLTSAMAWLQKSQTLVHWSGTAFESVQLTDAVNGVVTDVQSSGTRQARLLVEQSDGSMAAVAVSLRSGSLVSFEPISGVNGPAYAQSFFVIYVQDGELVMDDLRGYRRTAALPAKDFVVERMSNNWLHIYSPGLKRDWALYATQAKFDLSMLPGNPEQEAMTKALTAEAHE